MKVCIVCPYDVGYRGGVQAHVFGLATALNKDGHDICVMAPGEPVEPLDSSIAFVSLGSSFRFPANGSMAPVGVDPRMVFRMELELDRSDVVHIHEPLLPASIAACLRIPKSTKKVATFHAARSSSPPWLKLIGNVLKGVTSRFDTNLAVSESAAETARQIAGVKCEIVPNGVDTQAFATAEPDDFVSSFPSTVLFVGRPEKRKGLDAVLEAFKSLRSDDAHLVLIPGSPQSQTPLADRVHHLGDVSDQRKQAVFAAAHVAVFPATGSESFGIVLIEALAAGCHVVASDIAGYRSAGGDAVSWIKPGDLTALVQAIEEKLKTPRHSNLQQRLNQAQLYDWQSISKLTASYYN